MFVYGEVDLYFAGSSMSCYSLGQCSLCLSNILLHLVHSRIYITFLVLQLVCLGSVNVL